MVERIRIVQACLVCCNIERTKGSPLVVASRYDLIIKTKVRFFPSLLQNNLLHYCASNDEVLPQNPLRQGCYVYSSSADQSFHLYSVLLDGCAVAKIENLYFVRSWLLHASLAITSTLFDFQLNLLPIPF